MGVCRRQKSDVLIDEGCRRRSFWCIAAMIAAVADWILAEPAQKEGAGMD